LPPASRTAWPARAIGGPFLGTEDFRLAAISIYLKLGWRPFLYREEMEARWREVFAGLGWEFDKAFAVEQ